MYGYAMMGAVDLEMMLAVDLEQGRKCTGEAEDRMEDGMAGKEKRE